MTERVDIANLALSWLGESDITSLEDDINRAHQMRINYIPARDATLEAHDWSFAMMRFIPPLNATPPVYGAGQAFDIPANILRIISVDPNDTDRNNFIQPISSAEQIDWVFEDRQVICNQDVIYCRGIRRVEQEGKFSPTFVHALAAKLAFLTAINLTASAEIQANMAGLYAGFIHEAKSRDGLQGRSRRLRNRSLQRVR
jgi:hypothetical protein